MNNLENQYLDLLNGVTSYYKSTNTRKTRSGEVKSIFGATLFHDVHDGFPLLTTKKVNFNFVVGELLLFLSGKTDLPTLRLFSDIKEGANTIWSSDHKDYVERLSNATSSSSTLKREAIQEESLGKLYSHQWRNFGGAQLGDGTGTDQIKNLIEGLKVDPNGRRHIVTSYDPSLSELEYSLKPCHLMFQCYVTNEGKIDLKYTMRSNDLFLGAPFNLASYALLQAILAKLTGYEVGNLTASLGDAHVYESHTEAVQTQLDRKTRDFPTLILPEFSSLDELVSGEITAKDFKLEGYDPHPPIKAPLETAKVSV